MWAWFLTLSWSILAAQSCIVEVSGQTNDADSGHNWDTSNSSNDAGVPNVPTEGPAYEAEPWVSLGGPPGGVGYDIRTDWNNPDNMYVTNAEGGLFASRDGGSSWARTNGSIPPTPGGQIPGFCTTIDPHDSNTIWFGLQNVGRLYRSTDGGQSWEARDEGISGSGVTLRGITIHPDDPNTIYVGAELAEWAWGGQGVRGMVYRSRDTGESWEQIWDGENLVRYIIVDPNDTERIFFSTGIFDRPAANDEPEGEYSGGVGIGRSDDGGDTWTMLDESNGLGGLYVPSLFMHPTDSDVLIAAVLGEVEHRGVWATRDGGNTWTQSFHPQVCDVQVVEIVQSNPDIWYAAGNDGLRGCFWQSTDSGQNWSSHFVDLPGWLSGVPIDVTVDPRDSQRVFINNYGGGNVLTTDGGQTWQDASRGYTGSIVTGIAASPASSSTVFTGADLGTFVTSDGQTWVSAGLEADISPSANVIVTFDSPSSSPFGLLAGSPHGDVYRSDDGGQTWGSTHVGETSRFELPLYSLGDLVLAPTNSDVVFAGYVATRCLEGELPDCETPAPGFFRSEDGAQSWERLDNTPFADQSIFAIAVGTTSDDLVYVAAEDRLYRSTDGGASFQQNESFDSLVRQFDFGEPWRGILSIAIDPFDPDTILVSSYPGGVMRSQDGGATWEHASTGMNLDERFSDILFDPNRQGVVYVSTQWSGVYVSTTGGDTWRQINDGLVLQGVNNLSLSSDGSVLYAGVPGAGAFRLGTP